MTSDIIPSRFVKGKSIVLYLDRFSENCCDGRSPSSASRVDDMDDSFVV